MRILARSAVLATATAAGLAAPAVAATPTIKASPNPVHRGELVRVYGVVTGCGGSVTLISKAFPHTHDFAGLPAVFARRSSSGSYSVRVRIPARRAPGTYTITGRCGGGNLGVTRKLKVTA
jgi:hypothetical protein